MQGGQQTGLDIVMAVSQAPMNAYVDPASGMDAESKCGGGDCGIRDAQGGGKGGSAWRSLQGHRRRSVVIDTLEVALQEKRARSEEMGLNAHLRLSTSVGGIYVDELRYPEIMLPAQPVLELVSQDAPSPTPRSKMRRAKMPRSRRCAVAFPTCWPAPLCWQPGLEEIMISHGSFTLTLRNKQGDTLRTYAFPFVLEPGQTELEAEGSGVRLMLRPLPEGNFELISIQLELPPRAIARGVRPGLGGRCDTAVEKIHSKLRHACLAAQMSGILSPKRSGSRGAGLRAQSSFPSEDPDMATGGGGASGGDCDGGCVACCTAFRQPGRRDMSSPGRRD